MRKDEVLKYPLVTEKAVRLMNSENKILFVVDMKSNKENIKNAVEKNFDVRVDDVSTFLTSKGEKKAYVKLNKNYQAIDLMTKLGLM